jgi:hypothetical protein
MLSSVSFQVPLNEKHVTHFNVTTHNDLTKGLGRNIFRIIQQYNYSDTFQMRTRLLFKDNERGIGFDFLKWFMGKQIYTKFSIGAILPNGLEPPSISF